MSKGMPTSGNSSSPLPSTAAPSADDPDLIAASHTSIVRKRPTGNTLFVAAHLGLDCLGNLGQIDHAYKAAIAQILDQPPTRAVSAFLVERFFHEGGVNRVPPVWLHKSVSEQLFMPEHDRFWDMLQQGYALDVDPAWMA